MRKYWSQANIKKIFLFSCDDYREEEVFVKGFLGKILSPSSWSWFRILFPCSPPDKGELEGVLKIIIPNTNPSQPPPSTSSGQALLGGGATPDSGSKAGMTKGFPSSWTWFRILFQNRNQNSSFHFASLHSMEKFQHSQLKFSCQHELVCSFEICRMTKVFKNI